MPQRAPRLRLQQLATAVRVSWIVALVLLMPDGHGLAQSSAPPLRVCADPNNLPFSNREQRGFENQIASMVAAELGRPLEYHWWAQRRGFFRNTLSAGLCDLAISVPAGFERVRTTVPYYRSRYAFVTRKQRGLKVHGFDDEVLRTLRIGVQLVGDDYANTPPAHALARRHMVDNVVGFTLYGDYSEPSPPTAILDAVRHGSIDLAVVWGPLTASDPERRSIDSRDALSVRPVAARSDAGLPLEFPIAMGVRKDDASLQQQLDLVIERRRAAIEAILQRFQVPHWPPLRSAS